MKKTLKQLPAFVLLLFIFSAAAFSQDSKGISLYKEGKYKKAVSTLKKEVKTDANNGRLWNFLGMAQDKQNRISDAKDSFLKAVSLDSLNVDYLTNLSYIYLKLRLWDLAEREATAALKLDPMSVTAFSNRSLARSNSGKLDEALLDATEVIRGNPTSPTGYFQASEILISKYSAFGDIKRETRLSFLETSTEVLKRCLEVCEGERTIIEKRAKEQLEFLEHISSDSSSDAAEGVKCEPLKIKSKPRPGYTQSARNAFTSGTIKLRVVFKGNGEIGGILVLTSLPNGLTESAIDASRKIKFLPEMCGGMPRSVTKTIVYSFSIY